MCLPLVSTSLAGLFSAEDFRAARARRLIVPFRYDETTRLLLRRLKFHDAEEYAHVFAGPMADALRLAGAAAGRPLPGDARVLPVPLAAGRRRERGFNQAQRIARPLAGLLGFPIDETVLRRRRETARQTQLDYAARRENIRSAFAASAGSCRGAFFLLVDDIATSGLTLNEAAATLEAAGARGVLCLAAASPRQPEALPPPERSAAVRLCYNLLA